METRFSLKSVVGFSVFVLLVFQSFGFGLEPPEILVIANRNVPRGVDLALYYLEKRGIPSDNLLTLFVTDQEVCSREDYQFKIAPRVRRFLEDKEKNNAIRCLVTVYGMPLKIAPPGMTPKKREEYKQLTEQKKQAKDRLKTLAPGSGKPRKDLEKELSDLDRRMGELAGEDQSAALDSELALVKVKDYPLKGWMPNPHFVEFKLEKLPISADETLLVSRLDGPSPEIVQRIIDDSLETEKTGLSGTAYLDARWPEPAPLQPVEGYAFYDRALHRTARDLRQKPGLKVVLEDTQTLFQPGQCPDAALYCGWYSLGKYIEAFSWKKGAVGYHIASSECATLRTPGSRVWCKRMLEEGVAATLGPTGEPYVQAFPVPDLFFGLLTEGHFSLAECYFAATPFVSWRMVLIGDPLYRPFKSKTL